MKKILFFAVIFISLSACNNQGKEKVMMAKKASDGYMAKVPPPDNAEPQKPVAPNNNANEVSKKIIKEGEIKFETKNINDTRREIYSSVQKLGGYVAEDTETSNGDDPKEYTLKVRIPAKNFDAFLTGITSNAEAIDSKDISIKDVTTQYMDITTQLANKKKLEERYLELLKKAVKMSDLLEIESKLNEIRTGIDTTQGALNYLTKQIDYSTLDVTFYSKQLVKDNGQTFGYKLKTAFVDGWNGLGALFFGIISAWPLCIVVAIMYFIIKAGWRKTRERKEKAIPNKKPE